MNFETAKKILACIDLTSLNENDSEISISNLCKKAVTPYGHVAAVCVYPRFIKQVRAELQKASVKIATVVNFPKGEDELAFVLDAIQQAVSDGANEIDIVYPFKNPDPAAFLTACKKACGEAVLLKVILETGHEPQKITERAQSALDAGADFLKTSTGKIEIGATPEAAEILLKTIKVSGKKAGFKASGGIRSLNQAEHYLELAGRILGPNWAGPSTFRIGASQLVDDVIRFLNEGAY